MCLLISWKTVRFYRNNDSSRRAINHRTMKRQTLKISQLIFSVPYVMGRLLVMMHASSAMMKSAKRKIETL